MEQWTGSKMENKYIKVDCHLLIYFYAEYNVPDSQAGIKIARKNINNVRYADDTTLMAENEDELKCLSMRVKEERQVKKLT